MESSGWYCLLSMINHAALLVEAAVGFLGGMCPWMCTRGMKQKTEEFHPTGSARLDAAPSKVSAFFLQRSDVWVWRQSLLRAGWRHGLDFPASHCTHRTEKSSLDQISKTIVPSSKLPQNNFALFHLFKNRRPPQRSSLYKQTIMKNVNWRTLNS